MKKEIIKHLTNDFESYANQTQNEIEFWFARGFAASVGLHRMAQFHQGYQQSQNSLRNGRAHDS